MKEFDITLWIKPEQMTCGNCSRTISAGLETFFKKKSIVTAIAANSRLKQVRFSLRFNNKEEAELITNECKTALSEEIGYDCVSHRIDTPDIVNAETESINTHTSPHDGCGILTSILLLASGIFLMSAEYFDLLPPVSTTSGLIAQSGIGLSSSIISGWAGRSYLKNAWRHRCAPARGAMDSLIVLGCLSAILYSFIKIFASSLFDEKDHMTFFELPLFTLSALKLSHGIRDKLHAKIEENIDVMHDSTENLPKCAQIYLEADIKEITGNIDYKVDEKKLERFFVNEIGKNSIVHVARDEIVPIDGIVITPQVFQLRETFYGQKGLIAKKIDDVIYAGSINKSETPLLLKTICKAQDNHVRKAYASVNRNEPISKLSLEKVSQYFFRGVLVASIVSSMGWLIWGPSPKSKYVPQVFLSELLSACPCAIGFVNIGASVTKAIAFAEGILVQKDRTLSIDECTDVCFDKCGTLTTGEYLFKHIATPENNLSEKQQQEYLEYAIALESQIDKDYQSAVGRAILLAGETKNITCTEFSDNIYNKGRGGYAKINGHEVIVGNMSLLKNHKISISQDWQTLASKYIKLGDLPIFLALDGKLACLLILESKQEEKQLLRPYTQEVMQWLVRNNKKIHFLTGDSKARTIALLEKFPNIDIYAESEQTPQTKVNYIQRLQALGKSVVMIGDDKNDIDAIRQANFGLAIDTIAQIREEADAVLNGSLKGLLQLIRLSQINRRGYRLSLLWAFGINSVTLLAAAGILYPKTQMLLNPMITAGSMAFSSTLLILNLGLFKILGQWAIKNIDRELNQTMSMGSLRSPFLSIATDDSINSSDNLILTRI